VSVASERPTGTASARPDDEDPDDDGPDDDPGAAAPDAAAVGAEDVAAGAPEPAGVPTRQPDSRAATSRTAAAGPNRRAG